MPAPPWCWRRQWASMCYSGYSAFLVANVGVAKPGSFARNKKGKLKTLGQCHAAVGKWLRRLDRDSEEKANSLPARGTRYLQPAEWLRLRKWMASFATAATEGRAHFVEFYTNYSNIGLHWGSLKSGHYEAVIHSEDASYGGGRAWQLNPTKAAPTLWRRSARL